MNIYRLIPIWLYIMHHWNVRRPDLYCMLCTLSFIHSNTSELFKWTLIFAYVATSRQQGSSLDLKQSYSHILLKILTKITHTEQLSMLTLLQRVLEGVACSGCLSVWEHSCCFDGFSHLARTPPNPVANRMRAFLFIVPPSRSWHMLGGGIHTAGPVYQFSSFFQKQPSGVQRRLCRQRPFRFTPNTSREWNKQPHPPQNTFTHTEHRSEGNVT